MPLKLEGRVNVVENSSRIVLEEIPEGLNEFKESQDGWLSSKPVKMRNVLGKKKLNVWKQLREKWIKKREHILKDFEKKGSNPECLGFFFFPSQ